jgi:phospholipid/cholesterol/gamma-HCH transport system permease protein
VLSVRAALDFVGNLGLFAWRAARLAFVPPFECDMIGRQILEIGVRSLPLILACGFAIGLVISLHTRSSLIRFGAGSLIPAAQSVSIFSEIGPLVAALLVAGRVGAGIGAELAGMRVDEEIDAVEAFSIDSFKLLVIPRIVACMIALPLLTVFMDVAGFAGGYAAERAASHISLHLYLDRAFAQIRWVTFVPPTLKTVFFGFIVGLISSWFGYTADEGAGGIGRAATNSVVASSLLIIVADVILVKSIFFLFPGSAI